MSVVRVADPKLIIHFGRFLDTSFDSIWISRVTSTKERLLKIIKTAGPLASKNITVSENKGAHLFLLKFFLS